MPSAFLLPVPCAEIWLGNTVCLPAYYHDLTHRYPTGSSICAFALRVLAQHGPKMESYLARLCSKLLEPVLLSRYDSHAVWHNVHQWECQLLSCLHANCERPRRSHSANLPSSERNLWSSKPPSFRIKHSHRFLENNLKTASNTKPIYIFPRKGIFQPRLELLSKAAYSTVQTFSSVWASNAWSWCR